MLLQSNAFLIKRFIGFIKVFKIFLILSVSSCIKPVIGGIIIFFTSSVRTYKGGVIFGKLFNSKLFFRFYIENNK